MVSIREFQEIMKKIYFERDSKRGIERTFSWFKDEVKELEDELQSNQKPALEKEFADVLAWLSSLANLLNVDLEKAALSKYPNVCPKCKDVPCNCSEKGLKKTL